VVLRETNGGRKSRLHGSILLERTIVQKQEGKGAEPTCVHKIATMGTLHSDSKIVTRKTSRQEH